MPFAARRCDYFSVKSRVSDPRKRGPSPVGLARQASVVTAVCIGRRFACLRHTARVDPRAMRGAPRRSGSWRYSHSIVAGGLPLTS